MQASLAARAQVLEVELTDSQLWDQLNVKRIASRRGRFMNSEQTGVRDEACFQLAARSMCLICAKLISYP